MMMGVSWIIPVVVTTFEFKVPHRTASPTEAAATSGTCAPQTRFKNTGSPLQDSQIPLRHGSCSHSRYRGGRVASYLLCVHCGVHITLACPTMCPVAMKAKRLPAGLEIERTPYHSLIRMRNGIYGSVCTHRRPLELPPLQLCAAANGPAL